MSLKIKIPRKTTDEGSPSPLQHPESAAPNRRRATKRRVDSDEDEGVDPLNITPTTIRHAQSLKHAGISEIVRQDGVGEGSAMVESELSSIADVRETRFLPDSTADGLHSPEPTALPKSDNLKRRGSRKSLQSFESEDEDDHRFEGSSPNQNMDAESDDEDYTKQKRRKGPAKQKSVGKGRPPKGIRGKVPKESKDILMRDERKVVPRQENPDGGTQRPRSQELRSGEETVGAVSTAPKTPEPVSNDAEPTKEVTPPQPPPKKRKLPPIKKIKIAGTAAPSTPSSAPIPPKLPPTGGTSKGGADELPKVPTRTPAAFVGNADFDLRKPAVYAELFKSTGGTTPRSGLNRRERDEERRKELDRTREEARAKRVAEAKYSFDLQGQCDKISRFEEKLRQAKSSVLFPNFLGAKFKEDWEWQRRKGAEKDHPRRIK